MCYNRQLQALQAGQAGQKRQGAGTICNGGLGCTELAIGDDNIVESLRVRIKGQKSKADVTVEIYYRPPCQDDNTDELFFNDTSRSATLVLMSDFNLADISWEYCTADTNVQEIPKTP